MKQEKLSSEMKSLLQRGLDPQILDGLIETRPWWEKKLGSKRTLEEVLYLEADDASQLLDQEEE